MHIILVYNKGYTSADLGFLELRGCQTLNFYFPTKTFLTLIVYTANSTNPLWAVVTPEH